MLKIENIEVTGWEAAIRGMRNPMNSWDKSDSIWYDDWEYHDICGNAGPVPDKIAESDIEDGPGWELGPNDLKLMRQLAKAGSVHAKYRRMINVTMDITAPLYYLKELDTYKVGTVCNSCSTMHKIQEKEFTLEDFSCEHLFDSPAYPYDEAVMFGDGDMTEDNHLTAVDVNGNTCYYTPKGFMTMTCQVLNHFRELYLETKDKKYWWQMIQLLPSSYNQRRTYQFNYEVLSHIYFDRKDHKLDCWHTFCDMIRQLPYAEDIIIVGPKSSENDSMDILKKENEELKTKVEYLENFLRKYFGLNQF